MTVEKYLCSFTAHFAAVLLAWEDKVVSALSRNHKMFWFPSFTLLTLILISQNLLSRYNRV